MRMPEPDRTLIARRGEFIAALRAIVPGEGVITAASELAAYDCDGLTAYRTAPLAVVLPSTTEQVSRVMAYCHAVGLKIVPRGAGTSLSGGALPLADGIVLGLGKLNRVLEIDYDNRCVVAQPGVTNLAITEAVAENGYYYAPDPSSQIACTIGGNVAENSGGVHCLKYGMTTNNLLGLEVVLADGEVIRVGGKTFDSGGLDLLGVLTGEHGVGVEKRDLMEVQFSQADLDQQQRLRCAFDDGQTLNPGKVFPTLCRCAELGRVHVRGGVLRFADLPRF